MIITIGREYGSNGHKIGELVAQKLGIKLYDKKSLSEEAKKTEQYDELKAFYEEEPVNSLLYVIATSSYNRKQYERPFEFIRKIAKQEPCVIIGRCGNHILRDNMDATSVFIHAPVNIRIQRIADDMGIDVAKAQRLVEREDKAREWSHTYYADEKWNVAEAYHLCIDSNAFQEQDAADLIIEFAKKRKK